MKNITKSLIALLAIVSFSCTDDTEDRPVVVGIDAPVLSAPEGNNNYMLSIDNASQQAERFVWTSANFDQEVAVIYTVELDKAGNEFANPQSLGSVTGQNQLSVSQETLSGAVNLAGGTPFESGNYEVRVKASVNDTFEPMYSNLAAISVTSYVAVAPKLYLVGAVQAYYGVAAWTPEVAMPMRYIGNGTTKVFEAYVKVGAGDGFKFVGGLSWNEGNYGTIGGVQDGNLANDGGSGDIKVSEAGGEGFYYVQVNIDDLTYKFVKMNWGIIGAATPGGWDAETPMTYDFTNNKFTITTTLTADEMKFRSKNSGDFIYTSEWKFQVGSGDPKFAYDVAAGNIAVTAGTKTIELSIALTGEATVTGL